MYNKANFVISSYVVMSAFAGIQNWIPAQGRNDYSVSKLLNTYGYKKIPPFPKKNKDGPINQLSPCQQTDCYIRL